MGIQELQKKKKFCIIHFNYRFTCWNKKLEEIILV